MRQLLQGLLETGSHSLTSGQRATHTYVIGQPGVGKTRALESWIMQDIVAGRGVGVIDPHGDLFGRLVKRLAAMPRLWNRLVVIDPCNPDWTVSFNPLEAMGGLPPERLAAFLTDVVVKIWRLGAATSPRLIWLLSNAFLALVELRLTLRDLPRFLQDMDFRESQLPRLRSESARAYFQFEFPTSPDAIDQWVTPVLNKIGSLIFDPDLRLMLAGGKSLNFRNVLDHRLIVLVNLPKGILGEEPTALMGAFLVAQLQKAALARANRSGRLPFYLYLDEFQNYTTDNIKDILSKSRKYALSLTLAHQYLDQLAPDLRSAVLNTTGTLISFRVGYHDARQLVYDIFPSPDFLTYSERQLRIRQIGGFPFLAVDERQTALRWDGLAQLLARLPQRQFRSRRRGTDSPTKQRTLDVPDPIMTPPLRAAMAEMLNTSGRLYGRPKRLVRKEYGNVHGRSNGTAGWRHMAEGPASSVEGVPLWSE